MTAARLIPFVLTLVIPGSAVAMLTAEARDDFITATHRSCHSRAATKDESVEAREKKSRACHCIASRMADGLDVETVKLVESGQKAIDADFMSNALQWCKEHYMEYEVRPAPSNLVKNRDTNKSPLFNGKTHRFTAFRQHLYTKDFQSVRTIELSNGRYLFDLTVPPGGRDGALFSVNVRKKYDLAPFAGTNPKMLEMGYDFLFMMTGVDQPGLLALDSKRNILVTQVFNEAAGQFIETHYVRSQALICTALVEAKSRAIKEAASRIFVEILLVAIRSYAGTSYGGGTFSGYTSDGRMVSGTYTTYDNSWLGEHYSRGLDAVFKGTASLNDIGREMERLDCGAM